MRRIVRRAAVVTAWFSAAAGAVAFFSHGIGALVLDAWIVAVAAVLLLALARTLRELAPATASPFEAARARMAAAPAAPAELVLKRDVELSAINALHFHARLVPVLRAIAAHRLRLRYGVELEREAPRAREIVPSELWRAIAPDRPPPDDRLAPGPSVAAIAALAGELEKL